jgi:DNA-binding GntR family transcriptional regulator
MAVSIREHRDILEAARKGDAREAFEIMRRHVMKGRKYILQQDICAKETNG